MEEREFGEHKEYLEVLFDLTENMMERLDLCMKWIGGELEHCMDELTLDVV